MSLTVDELAKEIGRIYEGDDAWCRMVATGLLPFIERHIAAAAQSPGDSLSLHGTAGRSVSRAAECPCKLATCVEPWEPGCGLGTSAAHVSVAEPKPAGAVPIPEPVASVYRRVLTSGNQSSWCVYPGRPEDESWTGMFSADQLIAYGDAREAAGRAVAEGYVLVSRALLEQIYGMAREGCDAPSAAYRWCERIDEVFHAGDPSQEYADWEQDLPAAMIAAPIPQQPAAEGDDIAVDRFAEAMKAKMAAARAKGRGGWEGPTCNADILSRMLRDHVEKGDPRDVANFCMMLWNRGEAIQAAEGAAVNQSLTSEGAEAVYQYQTVSNGWHDLLDAADSEKYKAAGWPVRTLYTHPTPAADAGGVIVTDEVVNRAYQAFHSGRHANTFEAWRAALTAALTPEVRHA